MQQNSPAAGWQRTRHHPASHQPDVPYRAWIPISAALQLRRAVEDLILTNVLRPQTFSPQTTRPAKCRLPLAPFSPPDLAVHHPRLVCEHMDNLFRTQSKLKRSSLLFHSSVIMIWGATR